MGVISAADMATSDSRHVLIRSLGPEMFVSPDTTAITFKPATSWCSAPTDCMTKCLKRPSLEIVSQNKNIEEIASELVARAVEIDGNDNTTAQVIRMRSVEQVGMYRGRPYRLPG